MNFIIRYSSIKFIPSANFIDLCRAVPYSPVEKHNFETAVHHQGVTVGGTQGGR